LTSIGPSGNFDVMVTVSSKYQVVIPESVRKSLGIKPGMQLDVIEKGAIAYLVPVMGIAELQKRVAGKISTRSVREKKDRRDA
jgi:AbrB family looped-hinge helix DNA binding protein